MDKRRRIFCVYLILSHFSYFQFLNEIHASACTESSFQVQTNHSVPGDVAQNAGKRIRSSSSDDDEPNPKRVTLASTPVQECAFIENQGIPARLILEGNALSKLGEKYVLWREYTYDQGQTGTCAAHAVAVALAYNHGLKDIMPNYLYKNAWRIARNDYTTDTAAISYHDGVPLCSAMTAAMTFGSYQLPVGKKTIFGGANGDPHGCSFPTDQPRYAFRRIEDVLKFPGANIIEKIKHSLNNYHYPVVVASRSCIIVNGIAVMRIKDYLRAVPKKEIEEEAAIITTMRHGYVVFGYDDIKEEMYIKNSWGNGNWAERADSEGVVGRVEGGNAALKYSFIIDYVDCAWVGIGTKRLNPGEGPKIRPAASTCALL